MKVYIAVVVVLRIFFCAAIAKDLSTKTYPYTQETRARTDVIALVINLSIMIWGFLLLVHP